MSKKNYGQNTKLVHLGRDPDAYYGLANPPVGRASTILYPDLAAYENKYHQYRYARMGNPTSAAFEGAVSELEGGYNAISTPSGMSAVSTAFLAFLKAGDHFLVCDAIYPPTRDFCNRVLTRYGVEVEYYDPHIDGDIADKIKDNTAVIFMESPGSATFDIQDVPAIVKVAQEKGITTILDNSWSAGMLFKPLTHGVDVSVQSATKYISGHSDVSIGVAVARDEKTYKTLKKTALDLGICVGADDVILALRGMRTMDVRLKRNAESALKVAKWLQGRDEVQKVYHPALPEDSNHALWQRDFSGCNGVLSILLKPVSKEAVHAFVDSLELFPVGSSWGGYESLLQPQAMKYFRTVTKWEEEGAFIRLQIGLEDVDDLIADLQQAFDKFSSN